MDFKNNVPIYLQVINDIKRKLILGEMKPGDKLPSSRELALMYQINPNTAARVYNELEMMGMSFTRRGIGTFIIEDFNLVGRLMEEEKKEIVSEFMKKMSEYGFKKEDILKEINDYNEA